MTRHTALTRLARASSEPIFFALRATTALFSASRMGRLLAVVSIPRMEEHRLRSVLTTLGIALGVAVLVAVVLVNRSIVQGVIQNVDELAGKADLQVGSNSSGLDEALLDGLREVPGVHKVAPMMQQVVTLRGPQGSRERLLMLGVDMLGSEDSFFRSYPSPELEQLRRDPLPFLNSDSNLILSRPVAERLNVRAHDKVVITTDRGPREFEVWGLLDRQGVGAAFGGAVALMYYPSMQEAFGRRHKLDSIDVAVQQGRDPKIVARAIQATLGAGFDVQRPSLRGERIAKMFEAVRKGLGMASLFALVAGAFLVFNTISISIVQRKRELDTLRALGTTRRQLIALLTLEGGLLGLVGSALGVLLGLGISRGILRVTSAAVSEVYTQRAVGELRVDAPLVLLGFALGVLSATLAAAMATRRALLPRPGAAEPSTHGRARRSFRLPWLASADRSGLLLVALTLVCLALPPIAGQPLGQVVATVLLVLAARAFMPRAILVVQQLSSKLLSGSLGVEATLAANNLPRDMSRTASTASMLMASVALTVASATFVVSFVASLDIWTDQTLPGDLFVTSGAAVAGMSSRNTPMSDELGSGLASLQGVARVRRIRVVDMDFRGASVKLSATEVSEFVKRSYFSAVEGSQEQIARDMIAGGAVVSENFSRLFQVHRGDRIELSAQHGTRGFEVVGVVVDYTSDRGTIMLDRATYLAGWNDALVDTYELHLQPHADLLAVRRSIDERFGAKHDLFVLTNEEFRKEFRDTIARVSSMTHVVELVTLLVAMSGMITALLANVLDRIRELGVLRALGMLRKQVRAMVVVESMLVGAIGTLSGIVVGIALGYLTLSRVLTAEVGWSLHYRPPLLVMLQLGLVSIPLAALAGFYPAKKAASLRVTDALGYE